MRTPQDDRVTRALDRLDTAQQNGVAVLADETWPELSLDDAYTVQAALFARRLARGEASAGLKLGFTSEAKMQQMGVDELIVGHLTDAMQIENGGMIDLAGLIHPRVEPEIAFRVGRDVDFNDPALDVAQAVTHVCAALEVIDSRYEGFRFDLPRVVADNTSAAAFALGPWISFQDIDLQDLEVSLSEDGQISQVGTSSAILGHPLRVLDRLAVLGARWNLTLPAGSTILAGAATEAVPLRQGDICVDVASLGRVEIHVGGQSHE